MEKKKEGMKIVAREEEEGGGTERERKKRRPDKHPKVRKEENSMTGKSKSAIRATPGGGYFLLSCSFSLC